MMMGIGTPISQSSIERPMSASFFVSVLESWRLLNGQAILSFLDNSHQAPNARLTFSRKAVRFS
jgi:hypothetical protein